MWEFKKVLAQTAVNIILIVLARKDMILKRLVGQGHSVVVIEHDAVVLSNCHWIIEMGPGADSYSSEVIAEGTPYALKNSEKTKIGIYLDQCIEESESNGESR